MTQSTQTISPLRQRMLDDMRLRKLSPKTQVAYIRAVRDFTRFLRRSPDATSAEDLRRYQLHLVEQGISSGSLNALITGLRFFCETTLEHPEVTTKMSHVYEPRKLPVILSLEEVTRLLQAAGGPKYQAALGVAYGAGLRANEVFHLTTSDIDSERMVIRVEQGKGKTKHKTIRPVSGEPIAVTASSERQRQLWPTEGRTRRIGGFLHWEALPAVRRELFLAVAAGHGRGCLCGKVPHIWGLRRNCNYSIDGFRKNRGSQSWAKSAPSRCNSER